MIHKFLRKIRSSLKVKIAPRTHPKRRFSELTNGQGLVSRNAFRADRADGLLGSQEEHTRMHLGIFCSSQAARRLIPLTDAYPVLLASFLITGLLVGVRQSGGLQFLEFAAFDQMVRWHPQKPLDPRLLVIGISETDIQRQQEWPLSDQTVAQLLKNLQQHQPKVIGLDLFRDVPHPPGHEELQRQLQANNVIVVNQLGLSGSNSDSVPPPVGISKAQIGFSDFAIDADNVLRRSLMYTQSTSGTKKVYSFALRTSLNYLSDQGMTLQVTPDSLQIGPTIFNRLNADSGGYQMTPSEARGWQTLINYHSQNVAQQKTLAEVLQGKLEPDLVKDKVVLIGVTAPSEKDWFATPYSAAQTKDFKMSGVIVHAQMVSQILSAVLDNQPLFWFWPQWGEWLWIWGWSLLGGFLVWRLNYPLALGLAAAIAVGGLGGICFIFFINTGWIPFTPPALGLIATGISILAYKRFHSLYYDSLTTLPKRRLFLRDLTRQANYWQQHSQEGLIAILFLDLDRFKIINDGLGHEAGDHLLKTSAKRLQTALKLGYQTVSSPNNACVTGLGLFNKRLQAQLHPRYQLARVGGDEFAIWLRSLKNIDEATDLAKQLQQELTQPCEWKGQDISTSVSIGIAFNRTSQVQAEELLRYADIAMYRAKELGKDRHEVFVSGMDTQAEKRLELETSLRAALKRQEFQLYYQPIVSLETCKIAGFEALVRWHHPKRGLVSPGEFIPVAEETGLIIPLGQWILREACYQLRDWHQQFPRNPSLMISVNLSNRQFSQPDLVSQVKQILEEVELERDSLKLEITESMVMNDVEESITLLKRLKALGLRLSIDDFGTGYSSLSYLHRFPVDTLKIDKSFVGRMNEEESNKYTQIVRTIIMLGHNLELEVIAEGVETQHQLTALKALECEYGQGYFFAKPLSSEAALALLVRDPQWLL